MQKISKPMGAHLLPVMADEHMSLEKLISAPSEWLVRDTHKCAFQKVGLMSICDLPYFITDIACQSLISVIMLIFYSIFYGSFNPNRMGHALKSIRTRYIAGTKKYSSIIQHSPNDTLSIINIIHFLQRD